MRKLRIRPPAYTDRNTLEVGGFARTYWVAPQPPEPAVGGGPEPGPPPLLIGFHGLGSSGSRMAWWTGLGTRGPVEGFQCVFPDALEQIWDDHGCGRRDGADDVAFVGALIDELVQTGAADPGRVFMTGVSTGATFVERVVRIGAVEVSGIGLVTGTARVASCGVAPIAAGPTAVLLMAGTADPMLPYAGGLPRGSMGRLALKHVRRILLDESGHESAPPEALAAEWAAANGCVGVPSVDSLNGAAGGKYRVERLTWAPGAPGSPPVILYRIQGGGHGWPGSRQYMPACLIGPIPQHLDATAIVLDFARATFGCGAAPRNHR
jgi:polyhydroxybutyrate depolymerase